MAEGEATVETGNYDRKKKEVSELESKSQQIKQSRRILIRISVLRQQLQMAQDDWVEWLRIITTSRNSNSKH
jgi:hypothetical protein